MLRRLGSGVSAVAVALVTVSAVVLTASPAHADPASDTRISPIDAIRDALMDPGNFTDYVIADLNQNGEYDAQEPGHFSPSWMGTMVDKVGGTPAQVQSGEKLAGKMCKTGWGCAGALAAMLGLGALGTSDVWGPWVESDGGGMPPDGWQPSYYASERPNSWVVTGTTPSAFGVADAVMTLSGTAVAACGTGGCNVYNAIAADIVVKATGEWTHQAQPPKSRSWPSGSTSKQVELVPPAFAFDPAIHELRRVHFSERVADSTIYVNGNAHDRGFYWGQNVIPSNAVMESLTRCARPDGSTYDRVVSEPVGSGMAAVPACDPGDTPVYTQTTLVLADGTRELQSSQRFDSGAVGDPIFGPSCGAGCKLLVKADGVPCQVGMAACVDWSRDKADNTCWYGPYQLPLRMCNPLERAYQHPGPAVPATKPNTDGNPDTWDGPTPQLQPSVAPSPSVTTTTTTGPSPSVSPTVQPSSTSTASPSPTTSVPTDPATTPTTLPPGQPDPDPPADPAGARCFPSGWAVFNPFEWVYKPVMCALSDAFVPNPTLTTTRVQTVANKLDTKGPGPAIAQVTTLIDSVPTGGGCQGPGMTINLAGTSRTLYLFNACTEPMATAAGYSHALASVVLVIGGGLSVVRAIASAFGLNVSLGRGARDGD